MYAILYSMKKIILLTLFIILQSSFVQAESPNDYILIGKIGLYSPIVFVPDSDSSSTTYFYDLTSLTTVGRLQNTAWGTIEGGRTVLVGHTPGIFEHLKELEIDDQIIITMNGEEYEMFVFDKYLVSKDNDNVLSTVSYQYELVLITCTEDDDKRLIIKAK